MPEDYDNEDLALEGKLKTLVEVFKRVDESNDEQELLAIIELLQKYKWDVEKLSLLMRLGSHYCLEENDMRAFERILNQSVDDAPEPNLSEEEKLDRVAEMAKSGHVHYEYQQIKTITAALNHE